MTLSGLLIRPILFSNLHKRAKCAYFKNDKSQKKKKAFNFHRSAVCRMLEPSSKVTPGGVNMS